MTFFRKGSGRARELVGRIGLFATIVLGFFAVVFSRDFGGSVSVFHDQTQDNGIAHADAPSSAGSTGDSGSGGDSAGSGSSSDSGGSGSGG